MKGKIQKTGLVRSMIFVTVIVLIGVVLNACQTSVSFNKISLPSSENPLVNEQGITDFAYPTKTPSIVEGEKLFKQNCASCHGFGNSGKNDFTLQYINSVTPSQLFTVITTDIKHPSFKNTLTIKERWDAVMYLRYKLFGLPTEFEDMKTKFGSNCAVCHGIRGQGDGSLHYHLNPPPANFTQFSKLYEYTDEKLFDRIANGKPWTAMPPWNNRVDKNKHFVFDDKFIWELVKYIRQFGYTIEADLLRDEKLFGQPYDTKPEEH